MKRAGLEFRHSDIRGGGTYVYFLHLERNLRAAGIATSRLYLTQPVAQRGVRHYVDRSVALARRKRYIRRQAAKDALDVFATPFAEHQRLRGVARSFHCQDVAFLRTAGYRPLFARYWKHQIDRILDDYEHIIAISHATRADLIDIFGSAAARAVVIHHGIDPAFHAVTGPVRHEGTDVLRLIWVGNHHPRKRLDYAFDIVRSLARSRRCELVIVGNMHPSYADEARRTGACRIIRRAGLSLSELVDAYGRADALLWTSAYEGFGFPLAEAAACFCPVFAVNNSSVPEVLGSSFVEIPPENAEAAAEIIAATDLHAERLAAQVLAAKSISQTFTWDAAAKRTREVWWPSRG